MQTFTLPRRRAPEAAAIPQPLEASCDQPTPRGRAEEARGAARRRGRPALERRHRTHSRRRLDDVRPLRRGRRRGCARARLSPRSARRPSARDTRTSIASRCFTPTSSRLTAASSRTSTHQDCYKQETIKRHRLGLSRRIGALSSPKASRPRARRSRRSSSAPTCCRGLYLSRPQAGLGLRRRRAARASARASRTLAQKFKSHMVGAINEPEAPAPPRSTSSSAASCTTSRTRGRRLPEGEILGRIIGRVPHRRVPLDVLERRGRRRSPRSMLG